jgi:hypothetical protein
VRISTCAAQCQKAHNSAVTLTSVGWRWVVLSVCLAWSAQTRRNQLIDQSISATRSTQLSGSLNSTVLWTVWFLAFLVILRFIALYFINAQHPPGPRPACSPSGSFYNNPFPRERPATFMHVHSFATNYPAPLRNVPDPKTLLGKGRRTAGMAERVRHKGPGPRVHGRDHDGGHERWLGGRSIRSCSRPMTATAHSKCPIIDAGV